MSSNTNIFKNIRLIASDFDGTLTTKGKINSQLLTNLEKLTKHNISVLIVTGRSAGWVNALLNYLPVTGAIAENGGVFYPNPESLQFITPIDNLTIHRQKLQETFNFLKTKYPQIQESSDNRFRLTDWTFELTGLNKYQLQNLEELCLQKDWSFTYSTVQCHIKPKQQNKARGLLQVIKDNFSQFTSQEIITVGDSPNDELLFNQDNFPLSVGVANIKHYLDVLKYSPSYITNLPENEGFSELVNLIL